jgi:eukaryotic-like serine/threonine-protein kinase
VVEVLARRYEVGRVVGAGGTARVHEAFDRKLNRRVAIKLLDGRTADEAVRARFLHEATAAAKFTDPHAVRVYDTGEENGTLYLVMEFLGGPTLASVLDDRGPLEVTEAVAIADQILAAVGAGHEAGLVHRDIKPSNILFTRDGSAKLADFGIAKGVGALAIPLTATGQVIGTPRYLSPEQAAGRPASPPSDLYAVGVVLFEMLTGSPPFAGDTPLATALAHQQAPVPRLMVLRPEIGNELAAVVERALAKAPEDRYPDATAMRDALASPPPVVSASEANTVVAPQLATRQLDMQPPLPAGTRLTRRRRSLVVQSLALLTAAVLAAALFGQRGDGDAGDTRAGQPTTTPTTTTPAETNSTATASTTSTTAPATTTTAAPATSPGPPDAPVQTREGPAADGSGEDPATDAPGEGPPPHAGGEGPPPHAGGEGADANGN